MSDAEHRNSPSAKGFMARLGRDVRGNTMAIMAAALIPLAGMVGGGVDIARLYIVKTRLQHACDAGALAGRKAMGGGTWAQTVNGTQNYPNVSAERFFDANFNPDAYGTVVEPPAQRRSFTENAGKVTGTARGVVPMTLMKIFGRSSETLTVTCDAEMRLPNTDVMFVLDNTGSMGETPSGDSVTKLASLKTAVKCFYEIVARLNTDEVCTTGTPSGGTGDQVQIRFGFVPYDTNVNVGKLLPTAYFANSWPYQSREAVFVPETQTNWTTGTPSVVGTPQVTNEDPNSWSTISSGANATTAAGATNSSSCNNLTDPSNDTYTLTGSEGSPYNQNTSSGNPRTVTWNTKQSGWYYQYRYTWVSSGWSGNCRYQRRSVDYDLVRAYSRTDAGTDVTIQVFHHYRYAQMNKDISGLKNGTAWNASFQLPVGTQGALKTISWDGCVEERHTVKQASYSPIPADAQDLDIDLVPTQSNPKTLWGPVLPGIQYTRRDGSNNWTTAEVLSPSEFGNSSGYSCLAEAKKLQEWPDADDFDTYVDAMHTGSNTYHDIGLLWGARLMSPTGIFADENDYTPEGGEIERHMIFMTDGDPCTISTNYQAYGIAWYDRRQTDLNTDPGKVQNCTEGGLLTDQVNARVAAICAAIRNKNITLWVITFGTLDPRTVARMTACATPGRYFNATNAATIQATFKSIADQISQLRLTR